MDHAAPGALPAAQRAIRERCRHPTGVFIPFAAGEIEQSVPERFEAQARRHPERVAMTTADGPVTYAALDRAANRVARAIASRAPAAAAEPRVVGLLLEHDAAAVVAILGALKAGRAYLALDPALPPARLGLLLADAAADTVVTNARHRSLARALVADEASLVDLDAIDPTPGDGRPPGPRVAPDALFSLLYTSGSTGRPKAVVHDHRSMLDMIRKYTNLLGICPDDRLALLSSVTFNTSVLSVFGALLNGASVHPFDVRGQGVARLGAWLAAAGITIYHSVPTLFRQLVDTLAPGERLPAVRVVMLGGEPVFHRDVERYQARFGPRCLLVNGLGCTELSLTRQFFMDHSTRLADGRAPVGYPLVEGEVRLVDEAGAEVRGEGVGEIVLRSRHLARGYWRQPELTRAAFTADPADTLVRWFRTGDLGQLAADGCLTHLGRKDFQVKIRGHRVELEEVELALLDLPGVRQAAVTAVEETPGHGRLVAYVVPAGSAPPAVDALRAALAATLPDYMVPSAVVWLDDIPLTDTGKVDRQALPAPGRARPRLAAPYAPPRTPFETRLAAIWGEVLALDLVGIHDEFLALGGNSLLAAQILARVEERFGLDLPVADLLAAATVADMAVIVAARHAAAPSLLADLEAGRERTAPGEHRPRPRDAVRTRRPSGAGGCGSSS